MGARYARACPLDSGGSPFVVQALTVRPGEANSAAVEQFPDPDRSEGDVLVDAIALGVCGTDREIVAAEYGEAPPGEDRLVLGHESLGRVRDAPAGSGLAAGDLVAAFVRHPDPVPCRCCARGEWDFCRNGQYTEHGIKGRHGFGREQWRAPAQRLTKLDPSLGLRAVLFEPASIVAKAWEQIDRIAARGGTFLDRVLVTGAGPIGLLAAMLGRQRGHEVVVLDHNDRGPKRDLAEGLGATFEVAQVADLDREFDVVVEATGVTEVIVGALTAPGASGIVCLTGVSPTGQRVPVDIGGVNREIVLENNVVFGSVNANERHYAAAAEALLAADQDWLGALITRRVPLDRFQEGLERQPGDVKVVLEL
jgi:threonine dehydrogenase-like Zn-dependent dehydrogenase